MLRSTIGTTTCLLNNCCKRNNNSQCLLQCIHNATNRLNDIENLVVDNKLNYNIQKSKLHTSCKNNDNKQQLITKQQDNHNNNNNNNINQPSIHKTQHTQHYHDHDNNHTHAHTYISTPIDSLLSCTTHTAVDNTTQQQHVHNNNNNVSTTTITADNLKGTYYQRVLPSHLISFTSNYGKKLFIESMNQGYMESYFMLSQQYVTQNEPSYCGPATLAMCLNALQLDPRRVWKGVWRWWSEYMLQTCNTYISSNIDSMSDKGLSFEEFLLLAECNGCRVEAFRSEYSNINNFRSAIITACKHTDIICVVSYSRKVLGQTGSGHYSPIAGYHKQTDRVLVLDVARFKYPAYWVKVSDLWNAIKNIDESTGFSRGYYLMTRADNRHYINKHINSNADNVFTPLNPLICHVAIDRESWNSLSHYFCQVLPDHLHNKQHTLTTPASIFGEILSTLPIELSTLFTKYSFDLAGRLSQCDNCDTPHSHNDAGHNNHQQSNTNTNTIATTTTTKPIPYYKSYTQMIHNKDSQQQHDHNNLPSALEHNLHKHNHTHAHTHTHTHTHTHHHHPHSRPTIYSLLPLIEQIKNTPLYECLDDNIELVVVNDNNNDSINNTQHQQQDKNSTHAIQPTINNSYTVYVPLQYSLVSGLANDKSNNEFRSIELELTALLLYACPQQIFSKLNNKLQNEINILRDLNKLNNSLKAEIQNLRLQLGILSDYCNCNTQHNKQDIDVNVNVHDTDQHNVQQQSTSHTHDNNSDKSPTTTTSTTTHTKHRPHRFINSTHSKRSHKHKTTVMHDKTQNQQTTDAVR